jgi:hypothetical protein
MAGQNLSNIDKALKEFYLPRLQSTINEKRILMQRLERDAGKTDVSGRAAVVPINIRPSEAVGARGDESDSDIQLPTAQFQRYIEARINYKFNYGTIRMTHPTIVSAKSDKGSFVRVVGSEMDGIRRDAKNDYNRQLFGYGKGDLGTVASAASGSATSLVMDPGHRVKTNMVLDSHANAGSSTIVMDSVTVTAVSGNTLTVASVGSSTIDAGSILVRENTYDHEVMGLRGIVDNATKTSGIGTFTTSLHGVARGTYPEWNAQVSEHSTPGTAREISGDLIDQVLLDIQSNAEGEPSLGITSPTQFRKIGGLLTGDRRYGVEMTLEGGFTGVNWAGVPIVWDRDCPTDANGNHMLFLLTESSLKIYQLADWDFDDTDGAILHRRSGYAQYDATLFHYSQLGCLDPAENGVIRDLDAS